MKLSFGKETILSISDMHAPFQHSDTLDFLQALKEKYKPTKAVCLGDEMDYHSISDYEHDPDGFAPGREHEEGLKFLKKVYTLFKEVSVCTSNHTSRPFRRAHKFGIPKAFLKSYKDFMEAPAGWHWADKWIYDNIVFEHGEGVSGKNAALTAAEGNMQSTVIGHVHTHAGVQFSANPKHLLFGMNAGCLIDWKSYAFAYGKKLKHKPIIGTGVIVKGIPVFHPMVLNSKDRWIGKL